MSKSKATNRKSGAAVRSSELVRRKGILFSWIENNATFMNKEQDGKWTIVTDKGHAIGNTLKAAAESGRNGYFA